MPNRLVARLGISGLLVAASVVGVSATALGGAQRPSKQLRTLAPPSAVQTAHLEKAALRFAAANGEPSPTRIDVVGGNLGAIAERMMGGAGLFYERDVYLFALEGSFTGHLASTPHGAPKPRGPVLLIAFDAKSNEIASWGITDRRPDLSEFGQTTSLSP